MALRDTFYIWLMTQPF